MIGKLRLSREEQINKLTAKAFHGGLDDIDHRKLTRLISEADASKVAYHRSLQLRDKVIFTPEPGVFGYSPGSGNKKMEVS